MVKAILFEPSDFSTREPGLFIVSYRWSFIVFRCRFNVDGSGLERIIVAGMPLCSSWKLIDQFGKNHGNDKQVMTTSEEVDNNGGVPRAKAVLERLCAVKLRRVAKPPATPFTAPGDGPQINSCTVHFIRVRRKLTCNLLKHSHHVLARFLGTQFHFDISRNVRRGAILSPRTCPSDTPGLGHLTHASICRFDYV